MRRVFLLLLLLVVAPGMAFAGQGALKWIDTSGHSAHSSYGGSSSLVKEIVKNSNKKSLLYEVANETNNLAKKAAKAAGTGSKLGVAGAVGKQLVKGGKYGLYGAAGALVLDLGANYARDHWQDYPLLREILCQTLGMCPREEEDPSNYKPGDRPSFCPILRVIDVQETYLCVGAAANYDYTKQNSEPQCISGSVTYKVTYTKSGSCTKQTDISWKKTTVTFYGDPESIDEPSYPEEITPEQEEQLSERILEELAKLNEKSDQLAEELYQLIHKNPEDLLWDPLDNEEVKDSLYQDESDKLQQQKDEIEQQLNNDPDNSELIKKLEEIQRQIDELDSKRNKEILDEEQKKQEEEEKKEEEKFDPIGREEWEPYDPGPFNIPKRFNDMLNTVKGTALFSFSRGFFESLPSGGSPIVTFEGGNTFGNHTIDLSDTMQYGLVAFRAVVLVIFGFLAIRAVIMKR